MNEFFKTAGEKKFFKRNDFLKFPNSIDTNVYFVHEGAVKVFLLNEGEEQIIRFGYDGNIVVALDTYFIGKVSLLGIQAIRKSTISVISKQELVRYLTAETTGNRLWTDILEDLILQQFEREIDILTTSPKARYQRVLYRSPQLFQFIPLKYIANYLRMTPETLSRLRKY